MKVQDKMFSIEVTLNELMYIHTAVNDMADLVSKATGGKEDPVISDIQRKLHICSDKFYNAHEEELYGIRKIDDSL